MNAPRSNPCRIFIVDDSPAVREALRWAFEGEPDFTIIGDVGDGASAVATIRLAHPDVVILDIELPSLDGYTIAQTLKAAPQPPLVIFLSIHQDPTARQRCAEAGGDGFVAKGFGWTALIAKIRSALASQSGNDAA